MVDGDFYPVPRREVAEAVRLVREEHDRFWSVEMLARHVALSPSQLTRLFNRHLGFSPGKFLRHERIRRMARLLIVTDLSVSEAALRAGWRDSSSACRAFRLDRGVSPAQYRALELRLRHESREHLDSDETSG